MGVTSDTSDTASMSDPPSYSALTPLAPHPPRPPMSDLRVFGQTLEERRARCVFNKIAWRAWRSDIFILLDLWGLKSHIYEAAEAPEPGGIDYDNWHRTDLWVKLFLRINCASPKQSELHEKPTAWETWESLRRYYGPTLKELKSEWDYMRWGYVSKVNRSSLSFLDGLVVLWKDFVEWDRIYDCKPLSLWNFQSDNKAMPSDEEAIVKLFEYLKKANEFSSAWLEEEYRRALVRPAGKDDGLDFRKFADRTRRALVSNTHPSSASTRR